MHLFELLLTSDSISFLLVNNALLRLWQCQIRIHSYVLWLCAKA